jgi:hypothetical protein
VITAGLALADVVGTDGELAAGAGVLPPAFGPCAVSPTLPGSGVECGGAALGAELRAERLFQGRNDTVSELGGVLVGERPLG